jgi:hypothetical protein
MDINALSQVITETLARFDRISGAESMTIRLTKINKPFGLPDNAKSREQVFGMLLEYIQHVPSHLAELQRIGERYNIINLLQPFIDLSTNYLAATCRTLMATTRPEPGGLSDEDFLNRKSLDTGPLDTAPFVDLLQGAYIFNRLLEELNDEIESFIGIPLTGTSTMVANIIVHDVIGDKFANRLDRIIDALIARSTITKSLIEAQLASAQVISLKKAGCALNGKAVEDLAGRHHLSMF